MDDNDTVAVVGDIEDFPGARSKAVQSVICVSKRKRVETVETNKTAQTWQEALGRPPPMGNSRVCDVFYWCCRML